MTSSTSTSTYDWNDEPDQSKIICNFTDDGTSKDNSLRLIIYAIVACFALTWVAQDLARWLHVGALQSMADAIWNFGIYNDSAMHGEIWRFVTPIFLHAGWMHLLFNLLALVVLQQTVRGEMPRWAWLTVFIAGGIAGNLAFGVFTGGQAVGASGGIMALWGAAIACGVRYKLVSSSERPLVDSFPLKSLIQWLIFQFAFEFIAGGNTAHMAHVGGLVGGLIIGALVPLTQQPRLVTNGEGLFRFAGSNTVTSGRKLRHSYVRGIKVRATAQFDPSRHFLALEHEVRNARMQRRYRYTLLAGTVPATGFGDAATLVELANTSEVVISQDPNADLS